MRGMVIEIIVMIAAMMIIMLMMMVISIMMMMTTMTTKRRTGCRSVGDYSHKAWVGASVNIRSISNEDEDYNDCDDCDDDYHHHHNYEVGHGTDRARDLNGGKTPAFTFV